jgi:hypothetical protein
MKRLLKVLIPFCSMLGLLVLPGTPVGAIQNGTFDGNNHRFVCLVVFYDENDMPLWRTSGELLSPNVVLTAGHGTIDTHSARVWFLNQIPASVTWPEGQPRPQAYPWGGPDSYPGVPHTMTNYKSVPTPGLPGFDYHDVGIVFLSQNVPQSVVPSSQYGVLPAIGLVDTLAMKTPVDLVGYGVTSQVKGGGVLPYDAWTWNRQRNFAPGAFVGSKDVLATEFMKVTANPGQGKGGTTFGDSGGPILVQGTRTILAINAFVNNSNCDGVTYAQRIDIPDILAWINGYLAN